MIEIFDFYSLRFISFNFVSFFLSSSSHRYVHYNSSMTSFFKSNEYVSFVLSRNIEHINDRITSNQTLIFVCDSYIYIDCYS